MKDRIKFIIRRRAELSRRHSNLRLHWSAYVDRASKLSENTSFAQFSKIEQSSIGGCSYIGSNTNVVRTDIGSYCSIGSDCRIGGLDKHPLHHISTHPAFYSKSNPNEVEISSAKFDASPRTKIESDVWVGSHSLLLSGVFIATGCVIGAGSVVTKSTQPYGIYAGSPAKLIRFRFDDTRIEMLIQSRWWELSPSEVKVALSKNEIENYSQRNNIDEQLSALIKVRNSRKTG